jgi:hypothetical protein
LLLVDVGLKGKIRGAAADEVAFSSDFQVGPYQFVYGGLRGSTLLDDLLVASDGTGAEMVIGDPRSAAWWGPSLPQLPVSFMCTQ